MRLGQKGTRSDVSLGMWDTLTQAPPVERQHPPHCVIVMELGKPVDFRPDSPGGKHAAKRANRQRVEDRGESECRAVMVPDRRQRAPPERGAHFRVVGYGESVC